MDITDPEELAVLMVEQYLQERGYRKALESLEQAHGLKYVDTKLPQGAMLMELVYKHLEEQAAALHDGSRTAEEEEAEALLYGGAADFPQTLAHAVDDLHATNIVAIACWPGRPRLVSGQGNGIVQAVDFDGELQWQWRSSCGGILSLAFHPNAPQGDTRLLVGCMDGTVALLDAEEGTLIHKVKAHAKYAIRVRWSPNGQYFVSASWDNSFAVHRLTDPASSNAEQPAGDDQAGSSVAFETLKQEEYVSPVQDVEFLPDGETVVLALRSSNYLRLYSVKQLKEVQRINMNTMGDDHVSFTASHLALSPCRKYLLISTDGPRIIMYKIDGWTQVRNFYGLPVEKFHQPAAAWHASHFYVFAAAAGGQVYVFHVGSSKVAATFRPHKGANCRALDYDPIQNVLVTGSFDKTVKIYRYEPQGEGAETASGPSEP